MPHARRDDVSGVPPAVELQGEVVHVLGHAPELWIVVFGHQGDAHRAILRHCDPVAWAAVTLALRRATPANTRARLFFLKEGPRGGHRIERERGERVRKQVHSLGPTSPSWRAPPT